MISYFKKVVNSKYLLLASNENGDLALINLKEWKELSRLSIFKGNPSWCTYN
jgi:hypothetical protein